MKPKTAKDYRAELRRNGELFISRKISHSKFCRIQDRIWGQIERRSSRMVYTVMKQIYKNEKRAWRALCKLRGWKV